MPSGHLCAFQGSQVGSSCSMHFNSSFQNWLRHFCFLVVVFSEGGSWFLVYDTTARFWLKDVMTSVTVRRPLRWPLKGHLPQGVSAQQAGPLTRLVLDICFGPTLGGDLGDVHFLVLNLNLSRRTESKYPQREDTGHGYVQPPWTPLVTSISGLLKPRPPPKVYCALLLALTPPPVPSLPLQPPELLLWTGHKHQHQGAPKMPLPINSLSIET